MANDATDTVLLIEDDARIAGFIRDGLREARYRVEIAEDGKTGLHKAIHEPFTIIVLDLILPGLDGLEVLRELRSRRIDTPVLILSARRRLSERVLGLREGGDDYLVKPFAFEELLARLESLLRRSRGIHSPVQLTLADLTVNLLDRTVYRGDKLIELKPREFALLEYFMKNPGQVVTRTQILQHVWGYTFHPSTNIVEVHVCRLREKIERDGEPKLLKTVRGVGYVLGGSR